MHLLKRSHRYRFMRSMRRIPNLVSYHPLSEVAGTTAINYAGANLGSINGIIEGSPNLGVTGKLGRAVSMDGTNDDIDLTNSALLVAGTTSFSYGCICFFPAAAANRFPLASRTGAAAAGYDILVGSGGSAANVALRIGDSGGHSADSTNFSAGANAWHLVVGVIDRENTLLRLYVDGIEQKNISSSAIINMTNSQNLFIGKRGTTFWNNKVQHVFTVSRALTAAENRRIARKAGFL